MFRVWFLFSQGGVLPHRARQPFGFYFHVMKSGRLIQNGKSDSAQPLLAGRLNTLKGVLRVTNGMTVVKTPAKADETAFETIDDASITAQVKVALLLHRSTSSVNTKVGTTDGVVTVSGMAKNAAEETLVTKLATDISGVKSVVNNMTIAPALSGSGVKPARVGNLRVVSTRD